jgi:chromosome segregation ATPase
LPEEADSGTDLRDVLASGLIEELRTAQRDRWRAEIRVQSALDHLRFFESKVQHLEADLTDLRGHAERLEDQLARTSEGLQGVVESRAWKTVVRIRSLKSALIPGRR